MDKRILIGITFVALLCAAAWWFASPKEGPAAASLQPPGAPLPAVLHSAAAEPAPTELTSVVAPADTQRAAAAETTPVAATAGTALVKVLVIDKSTRAKMPGVEVTSRDTRPGKRTWNEDHGLSHGKQWDTLRTDAEGRAEIETTAREELVVTASADRADAGSEMKMVEPLEPGTTKELVLEIATGIDLPYWMKVVDEATLAPLSAATASIEDDGESAKTLACDSQGLVFVPTRSWRHSLLHVRAPEHAELYLMPQRGHERMEDAFVVALLASATLHVHVVDGNGANVPAARVVLTTHGDTLRHQDDTSMTFRSLPDPRWEALTDASGMATLTGIRPRVPIKAGIEIPRPWTSPQDLTFEPGETRDVEWKLTNGCDVHGILLDQTNAPVVARDMWMRKADRKIPSYFNDSSGDVTKTVSDQQGRFRFGAISSGTWWIGPAPVERGKQAAPDDVAALAQVVEVVDGQEDLDVTLHVDRGLRITGKVLDPKGAAPDYATVSAYDEKSRLYTYAEIRNSGGEFAIGPLMAGRYALKARSYGRHAESLQVEVDAGTSDVVLQLRPGATIAGTVVDENGQSIPAVVCLSQRDVKFGMQSRSPGRDGDFEMKGLEPGTYQVSAHTADGRIGILDNVEATTTEPPAKVVVQLHPGGHVRARHRGPEQYANISLAQNGIELAIDGVKMGETKEMVAPVGTVVVRADFFEANRTAERTVEVRAGETVDVVFEKDAH